MEQAKKEGNWESWPGSGWYFYNPVNGGSTQPTQQRQANTSQTNTSQSSSTQPDCSIITDAQKQSLCYA